MPDFPNPNYQTQEEATPQVEAQEKLDQISEDDTEIILSPDQLSETIKNESPTKNHFAAFAPKPHRAFFESQLKKEEIVLLLRRHPITQLSRISIIAIAFFFPTVMFASPMLSFMPLNLKMATVISWCLLLSGFTLETFLTWFFRVFIITNKRVIDVDYYSMVHKDVTVAELIRIQDMSVVSTGVFASLIDYGTLYLQTAGQNFNPARFKDDSSESARSAGIEFEDISQPMKVKRIISELIATKKRKNGVNRNYQ